MTHVVRDYGRLSETFVQDAVRNVDRHGCRSEVVTLKLEHPERIAHPPRERIHVAEPPGPLAKLRGRLRRQAPVERGGSWFAPAVRESRPAVLHVHFGWAVPYAAPAARHLDIPIVATLHATDVTVWPYEDPRHARALRAMDVALVVSRFTERRLRATGYDGDVAIEPGGVALDAFAFRGPRSEPRDDWRLVFVGRLVERKGIDVAIRVLAALDDPDVTLTVVGDGPLRSSAEALAIELGVGDRVDFRGALPSTDVRAVLAASDLLLLTSRTTADGEAEGSPTVLKEALAIGLAVAATDNGGTVEVMPPGIRGEIVAEDDPDALAGRVRDLLARSAEWERRAADGRRWVEAEFDADALAERLVDRYRSAMGRFA